MAKGYWEKIDDILDKMMSCTDKIFPVLHTVDDLVYHKLPCEFTEQDISKLQNVIEQVDNMLREYNNKVFGIH